MVNGPVGSKVSGISNNWRVNFCVGNHTRDDQTVSSRTHVTHHIVQIASYTSKSSTPWVSSRTAAFQTPARPLCVMVWRRVGIHKLCITVQSEAN